MKVTLEEITEDTLDDIMGLGVTKAQEAFCPGVAVSIAQAHFSRYAWFRAVYAGDTPVGFVMLYLDGLKSRYSLWRLLIDKRYQGKGYGKAAIEQVVDFVRTLPEATELTVTYPPVEGNPSKFFAECGFVETGETENDEKVMKLTVNG